MANRYWVGGNATWDSTAGTKWATTSNGTGGSAVPTASDDVFLDGAGNSGNVTIATGYTAVCKSLTCTGYVGTLSSASSTGNLTVSGNITLVSGMTLSVTGLLTINATSTVTSAGKTWGGGITVSGSAITVTLASDLACSGTLTLTQGTLDCSASNYNISCAAFSSSNSNTRTLTLRAGVMTITGTGTAWDTTTVTSFTWGTNSANSGVVFSYSGSSAMTINSGAFTVPTNVDFKWTGGTYNLTKPTNFDTAHNIDFTGYAGALQVALSTKASTLTLSSGMSLFTGNALTLTGSGGCTLTCAGKTITTFTISGLTGTLTFADTPGFTGSVNRSIAMVLGTGVSATFSGLTCSSLNFGSSGSLTLTGAVNGGNTFSGSMSGTGSFYSTYTGSIGRTFNTNAASTIDFYIQNGSGTVTLGIGSGTFTCNNFYSTGFTGTFTISGNDFAAYGSTIDFASAASYSSNGTEAVYFYGATITSFSLNKASFGWGNITFNYSGVQSVTLGSDLKGPSKVTFNNGTNNAVFDTNGYNFTGALAFNYTADIYWRSGSHTIKAYSSDGLVMTYGGSITGGTSTVTFDGTTVGVYFRTNDSGTTLYAITGSFYNIVLKGIVYFKTSALTANNLSVTLVSGTNQFSFFVGNPSYYSNNSSFYSTFTLTSLTLAGDATHTYTLTGNVYGSGSQHSRFVISSGVINCDYLALTGFDASGGATFYYGANSTLSGSPLGWAGATAPQLTFLGHYGLF